MGGDVLRQRHARRGRELLVVGQHLRAHDGGRRGRGRLLLLLLHGRQILLHEEGLLILVQSCS